MQRFKTFLVVFFLTLITREVIAQDSLLMRLSPVKGGILPSRLPLAAPAGPSWSNGDNFMPVSNVFIVTNKVFGGPGADRMHWSIAPNPPDRPSPSGSSPSGSSRERSFPPAGGNLEANYYTTHFGFFCKRELELEKTIHLPVRFRLGSLEYCNRLEGK